MFFRFPVHPLFYSFQKSRVAFEFLLHLPCKFFSLDNDNPLFLSSEHRSDF